MTKDFYIFRHGQSTYNLEGRTQGQTNDSVLTELGREQAATIGSRLKGKGIEIIVSSPLTRALQTAELANKELNVPVKIDDRFTEVNVGVVEGWHYTKIMAEYGDVFDKLHHPQAGTDDACYPGGESKKQVRERVFAGLEEWAAKDEYTSIAVSSHGIMLAQTCVALNQPMQDIKNAAILHIRKDHDTWKIIEWL